MKIPYTKRVTRKDRYSCKPNVLN